MTDYTPTNTPHTMVACCTTSEPCAKHWNSQHQEAPNRTNGSECPQPCVHLSQEDAREGVTCPEHPCTCADRTIRSDDDKFAPGECDGSGTCTAPVHVHGCYTPHRSDQCDSPDEYGHTDRTIGASEEEGTR